jgi:hypothetical protein
MYGSSSLLITGKRKTVHYLLLPAWVVRRRRGSVPVDRASGPGPRPPIDSESFPDPGHGQVQSSTAAFGTLQFEWINHNKKTRGKVETVPTQHPSECLSPAAGRGTHCLRNSGDTTQKCESVCAQFYAAAAARCEAATRVKHRASSATVQIQLKIRRIFCAAEQEREPVCGASGPRGPRGPAPASVRHNSGAWPLSRRVSLSAVAHPLTHMLLLSLSCLASRCSILLNLYACMYVRMYVCTHMYCMYVCMCVCVYR